MMSSSYTCQCCLAPGSTKDIFTEYFFNGQKEVYSEMLQNTLNIIIPQDKSLYNNICEQCIADLRKATEFKAKVLNARSCLAEVRSPKFDTEEFDDFDDKISVDFGDDSKAGNLDGNEKGHMFFIKLRKKKLKSPEMQDGAEIMEGKEKKDLKGNNSKNGRHIKGKGETQRKPIARQTESQTHKDLKKNSLNLVFNSNLCLFKSLKTKFGCFLCEEAFFTIKELRQHGKTHSNTEIIRSKFNRLRGSSYYNTDISSLECTHCSQACSDLTDLKKHLTNKHGVEFGDAGHFLIPYKLEDTFNCVVCDEKFNTYMRLSVHMNTHYSNNVCEKCGKSYINRMSLRIHLQSRHKEKKCSLCPETFLSNYARVRHMRSCHNSCKSRRHCLICGNTFRYTYQLVEHKIQEHGLKRQLSKCTMCSKTFPKAENLKVHVRSVHAKERNFPCSECERRFFTKFDLKRHEKTHDDVKSFSCDYCQTRFKGKDSLRRHLKRVHANVPCTQKGT